MTDYLPFLVLGITTGAVFALAAMGLVLTYTTSGVFNFAHGAVGMFATYVFWSLRENFGVPTPLAVAVAVLLVAPALGLVIDRVLLRRLAGCPPVTFLVASLGLLVALQSLAIAVYGGETRQVASLFPTGTYRLSGVNVGFDQTIMVIIAVAAGIGLAAFFSRTHAGLQTQAVVGDPALAELAGTNTRRVTAAAWMAGSAFAALSGILFSPFVQLDSLLLTLLVVQAFGAAVVGRLRSFSLTNAGAYGIAIAAALATKVVATRPALAGLPSAIPFIVLFAVLVISRKGSFTEVAPPAGERPPAPGRRHPPSRPAPVMAIAALLAAVAIPFLNASRLVTLTTAVAFFMLFSSLGLLVGLSRQISLCHAVFAAFGATSLAHFTTAGVPYPAALLAAGAVMVPVGALLAVPAVRLSGLFLALATFAFGVLAQNLLYGTGMAFGRDAITLVPRPGFASSDIAFAYFVLAVAVAGGAVMELIRVSRLGRVLRAVGDSPTGVESLGMNPTASRVIVFCVSAFFAAIAGALLGSLVQLVNPSTFSFYHSLVWLTVIVTGGILSIGGRLLSVGLFVVVPAVLTSSTVAVWQPVGFGVAAMLLAQQPNGLAGLVLRRPDFARLAARSAGRIDRRRAIERYVAFTEAAAR